MPAISRPDEAPPTTATTTLPIRRHRFPSPKLRLHIQDLSHDGSSSFLSKTKGNEDLDAQVQNVLNLLYASPSAVRPATRSVTFILRDFGGIAYTTGSDLDSDHKEIHLSTAFLSRVARHEILGVLCHELVHCFQYNACGTCPGGLIEGIADWVRLNAGLAATHWRREAEGKWDQGYQHTGYFLQWLEEVRCGRGTVRRVNEWMGKEGRKYDEKACWIECCGHEVGELWGEYVDAVKKEEEGGRVEGNTTEGARTVPTDTPPRIQEGGGE